jgi:hypothetical protein
MTWSLPHSDNKRQLSVNDFWLAKLDNLSVHWLQPSINNVLATFKRKNNNNTLHAPLQQSASKEHE